MGEEAQPERRPVAALPGQRACPWCRGQLVLEPFFPIRRLIPGEVKARGEEHVPEALRTIRAWVCSTPHCRFRESA